MHKPWLAFDPKEWNTKLNSGSTIIVVPVIELAIVVVVMITLVLVTVVEVVVAVMVIVMKVIIIVTVETMLSPPRNACNYDWRRMLQNHAWLTAMHQRIHLLTSNSRITRCSTIALAITTLVAPTTTTIALEPFPSCSQRRTPIEGTTGPLAPGYHHTTLGIRIRPHLQNIRPLSFRWWSGATIAEPLRPPRGR